MNASFTEVKSEQELQQLYSNNGQVVLHFWAPWCEPCKHMDVILAELVKDYPAVKLGRVEAEEVDSLTVLYGITSVPTFVFLHGPAVVGKLEGANPPALTAQFKHHFIAGEMPSAGNGAAATANGAAAAQPEGVTARIQRIVSTHPVVLFMKGTPDAPRCGFSRKVVDALQALHSPIHAVDILQDPALREELKKFSNWPTYPQLYVNNEFVGGCDIVMEMQISGELKALLVNHTQGASTTVEPPPGTAASTAAASKQKSAPAAAPAAPSKADVKQRIESVLKSSPVILFMKGSPNAPQCGFSRKVVEALQSSNITFQHFDILGDEVIRQGLKEYSNWPTYPQLYVNGELVGGCDIVLEMQANNELKFTVEEMLGQASEAAPVVEDLNTRLKRLVAQRPVMIFMKGSPQEPRCGFSSKVVQMVKGTGVEFGSFDILTDEEVRQGLKEFSNWPTYPQVYVSGELLGGCDIVTELHNSGELKTSIDEMLQKST